MNNRLRETAVTVAVWASSQHAIAQVWFAGPRVASAQPSQERLEIVIVMTDDAEQAAARSVGRRVSTSQWESDLARAVRGPHEITMLAAGASVSDAQAVRIFSRRAEIAPDIVYSPSRTEKAATSTSTSYNADACGDIGNVRPL